jgi:hypothetical protein
LALALQIGFLKLTGRTLNSVELIPPQILDHLGRQVGCAAPRIASIRAFYRRRHRTLFEHHASALRLLGRSELTPHAERGLVAYLRREAAAVFDDAELMARARSWLVEHDYLLLRERHIRRLAIAARRHQQQVLFKLIATAMPAERDLWVPRLLATIEEGGISRREWLDAVPSSRSAQSLAEQMEKVSFLKELGGNRLALPELPLAGLEYFARRMMSRKPAALTRIKDPHRTIEVACFLRLTLLRLTDASLTLLDHQISALWRGARERVEETQAARLRRFRRLLGDLAGLADNETLDAAELRSRLKSLITPFEPERQGTQVASIRQELGRKSQDLARLLKLAREAPLAVPAGHKLAAAFATLNALSGSPNALPDKTTQPFGPSWQTLIDQPDRAAALGCFRAATLMGVKRALRNRSVSVDHSLSHRAPEDKLIPQKLWQRDQGRFIRDLNLPASSEKYLQRLEAGLSAGLAALAEAVEAGAVVIESGEVRLPRRKPGPKDPRLEPARQALAHALIPQVLRPIVAETVSRRAIARGWEGFLRLGASVKHGWDSATAALDRFGSAAAGDPIYNAGDGLGKLLRTLYLCDYLGNPVFRLEVLDLLNQGEAVHSLQRAIHNRMITAKHGRTMEELGAISGALTLLANIVMAWNTHRIQAMIDASPGDHPDEVMRGLAPIGHKHINMRGILTFDLGRHRSSLLRQAPSAALERVPG